MGGKAITPWSEVDKEWLRSRYRVDCATGEVFLQCSGEKAPLHLINPSRKQYLAVSAKIGGKWTKVRLHHLVWFFATGEQSLKMIDHKEPEQDTVWGNRYENLRQCTDKQNRANIARKGYKTAYAADGSLKGYYAEMTWKCSSTGKIKRRKSRIVDDPEVAAAIYWNWQRLHHKEFAYRGDVVVSSGCSSQIN